MTAKAIYVLCAQAILLQGVCSQYLGCIGAGPLAPLGASLGAPFVAPLAGPGLASVLAYDACGVASNGGSFPVTSASPIAPTGVSIVSENAIEGALAVGGNLPLLGSVAVEGAFPTAGAGSVSYGCGNGAVVIDAEVPFSTGILAPGPVGPSPVLGSFPGLAGGLAPGLLGRGGIVPGIGCGCGYY